MRHFELEEKTALLRQWLEEAGYAVFFGGAGVSTDSGLADFRGRHHGLYFQENPYHVPTEQILTRDFFFGHTEEFFEFYRTKLLNLAAAPNYVHYALAGMERRGLIKAIITQNADNLHQRAGSVNVIDLHGNVYDNTCLRCGKKYPPERVANCPGVPRCGCGGVIRPGIVLFGEVPDMGHVMRAVKELRRCDLVLIGGSSMKVSSASRLFRDFRGRMVILNSGETAFDSRADLILRDGIGDVFRQLWPSL